MRELAKEISRLSAYRHLFIGLLLVVVFVLSASFTNYYTLSTLIQCLTMAISVAVIIAYSLDGWDTLRRRRWQREDALLAGILMAWSGNLLRSGMVIWWRATHGNIPLTSDWVNFFNGMVLIGGVLHITAPGSVRGRIPTKARILLAVALSTGITFSYVLLNYFTDVLN